ncbi:hypothetical protein [Haemophilus influenzae]|uniref:hypothetical protein n=1 Tax=Haemophilus influenzae TaxID=727 RepID=UPI000D012032|nr:hypothetical protein [Haemophilus influenzae]PRM46121.1 hypothetical protein BVZ64_01603 [Haemophilus influenzae]
MKSFKLTLFLTLLAGGFGYIASCFVVRYFETDVSGVSFLLVAFLLLPITQLGNIIKELSSDSIYNNLNESEKRRLKKLIQMKRKRLYILVGLLVILSVLCTLGFQLVTQYKAEFLFSLIGVTLADIVFFFHALAVMDEINDFKNLLKDRQEKSELQQKTLERLKSHSNYD